MMESPHDGPPAHYRYSVNVLAHAETCVCVFPDMWVVLMPLVPCLMLLMTHQPHLYQPWRLDRCNTFSLSLCSTHIS